MLDDLRGYKRRTRPQATQGLPQTSTASFGAGVGDAIGRGAQVVSSEALEDRRIDRRLEDNRQWSEFQVGFAQFREGLAESVRDGRQNYKAGHADRMAQNYKVGEVGLLEGITSNRVKERARAALATYGSQFRAGEQDWETVRIGELAVDQYSAALEASANRVRRLEEPQDYVSELAIQLDAIEQLETSDKAKGALERETRQKLGVAFIRGMTDRDPIAARAMIDGGAFDEILTDDQVEVLRNGTGVEIRRLEAAAAREQAEQAAQLREQITYFEERQGNGFYDDPESFEGPIAAATALGDASRVEKLKDLQADAGFIRVWGPENANALQRERRLGELAGKDNLTDLETRELDFLRRNSSKWATEEFNDPVGQAIERGGSGAPPAIDFEDPQSLLARGRWAAARGADGAPVSPLSRDEARSLGRIFDSGGDGREQVLELLSQFQPAQAMEAARMMDPEDRTLPIIATLDQRIRNMALRGRGVLADNRKLLTDAMKDNAELAGDIEDLNQEFGRALNQVRPEQRGSLLLTAQQILAGYNDRTGGDWSSEDYLQAINMALGSTGVGEDQRGGLSRWGGELFLLPSGYTKREFKSEVAARAQTNILPPVNPDGSTVNILRLVPVPVGNGLYEFHSRGGAPARTKEGEPWRVRMDR